MQIGVIVGLLIGGLLIAGVILVSLFGLAGIADNVTAIFDNITEITAGLTTWFVETGETIIEFFSELFSFLG